MDGQDAEIRWLVAVSDSNFQMNEGPEVWASAKPGESPTPGFR
jgi:hypothetical protein